MSRVVPAAVVAVAALGVAYVWVQHGRSRDRGAVQRGLEVAQARG